MSPNKDETRSQSVAGTAVNGRVFSVVLIYKLLNANSSLNIFRLCKIVFLDRWINLTENFLAKTIFLKIRQTLHTIIACKTNLIFCCGHNVRRIRFAREVTVC